MQDLTSQSSKVTTKITRTQADYGEGAQSGTASTTKGIDYLVKKSIARPANASGIAFVATNTRCRSGRVRLCAVLISRLNRALCLPIWKNTLLETTKNMRTKTKTIPRRKRCGLYVWKITHFTAVGFVLDWFSNSDLATDNLIDAILAVSQ